LYADVLRVAEREIENSVSTEASSGNSTLSPNSQRRNRVRIRSPPALLQSPSPDPTRSNSARSSPDAGLLSPNGSDKPENSRHDVQVIAACAMVASKLVDDGSYDSDDRVYEQLWTFLTSSVPEAQLVRSEADVAFTMQSSLLQRCPLCIAHRAVRVSHKLNTTMATISTKMKWGRLYRQRTSITAEELTVIACTEHSTAHWTSDECEEFAAQRGKAWDEALSAWSQLKVEVKEHLWWACVHSSFAQQQ
jgi:hypothetical protein